MEIDLALLADAATIDASGKLNILGIFDRITAKSFPAQHSRITLVLRFAAGLQEAGSHEMEIRLKDPAGGEVVRLNGSMQLGPGTSDSGAGVKVPHILNLDGMVFPEPGMYIFDVLVDGEHHVSIPLMMVDVGHSAQA